MKHRFEASRAKAADVPALDPQILTISAVIAVLVASGYFGLI